jgi:hypothetical protein
VWLLIPAFFTAVFLGAIDLPSGILNGEWSAVWVLLAWVEFITFAVWAGGFPIRGPLGPLAFLGGALMGELGTALVLAPRAPTPKEKARVVLTASAGALISPVGTPVTLLLVEPGTFGVVLPLALAALSWPRAWAQDDPQQPVLPLNTTCTNRNLLVLFAVVAGLFWGISDLWVLGLGCFALLIPNMRVRGKAKTPWGKEIWILAVAILCMLSISSGAFWELQQAIGFFLNQCPEWAHAGLVGAGALLSIVGTEEGAVLVAQAVQNTGFSTLEPEVWKFVGAGIAMGGIGPLLLVGAFRAGLWIWILQLGLVLLWANAIH